MEWKTFHTQVEDIVENYINSSVKIPVIDAVKSNIRIPVRDVLRYSIKKGLSQNINNDIQLSDKEICHCYYSSFFTYPHIKNPLQSGIDLWDAGLVPSFDGKTWRLHRGEKADIVYEMDCVNF